MTSETEDSNWPLPKFYFSVKFDSLPAPISFQEVTGLDAEPDSLDFRHGNNPVFSTVKMSGSAKSSTITLKNGVFPKKNDFWKWFSTIKMNTIKREKVLIQLLDESDNQTITWVLTNAFPTKITGTDSNEVSEEIAIESLELSHEGLTISNP
ncbi:phage tail protein [Algoriphagus sp.]|uniref:phage tail protein n=1 Tax=Algoriphagus sp. TaxID=1872435 RepID=UPI00327E8DD7